MKKKNPIHAYKRLLANDEDWGYSFLLALEKKKLQRMHDCIKSESRLEHKDFVVRDIAICIRLIDIFMEEDAVYKNWLNSLSGRFVYKKINEKMNEVDVEWDQPIADYPVYVNVRNERRFFRRTPIKDAQTEGERERTILSIPKLRQEKALHMYHLIREYKLLDWWC